MGNAAIPNVIELLEKHATPLGPCLPLELYLLVKMSDLAGQIFDLCFQHGKLHIVFVILSHQYNSLMFAPPPL